MSFQFISNNSSLNNATKKQIRSHAALGKNKGKKILRRSRKDALAMSTTSSTASSADSLGTSTIIEEILELVANVKRPIGDGLFLPFLLHDESKQLVKKVISFMNAIRYSRELSYGLNYTGLRAPICVQNMFVNEACFHSLMATATQYLNKLVSEPENVSQVMRHVSHTFRLVNKELSGKSAVSDTTISAILNMAQYEHHQKQYQQGLVHVQGLHRIVQLRGGLSQPITSAYGLTHKILWVDLECSLQLGTPTLFATEEAFLICKTTTMFPSLYPEQDSEQHCLVHRQHLFKILPAGLRNLLIDMMFLATILNDAIIGNRPGLNALEFHKDTLLLGYRLVKLQALVSPGTTCCIQNRVYLGLTAFLATLIQEWDGSITENILLRKLLLCEIEKPRVTEQGSQEVLLWMLFIGAASSCLWEHPAWISTTKSTIHVLGVKSWADVQSIIGQYPWIHDVHQTVGKALWNRSNEIHSVNIIG